MKYEDVIKRVKEITAPELDLQNKIGQSKSNKMDAIIDQLKKTDLKARISIRILQFVYLFLILAFIYLAAFELQGLKSIGLGSIVIAFILVIVIQQFRYRAYTYSYENHPAIKFLKDARKRMQVFTVRSWLVIPAWMLIDAGICMYFFSFLQSTGYTALAIIAVQLVVIVLVIIDFYTAYLIWKREQEPIVLEIEKMIKDLEEPDQVADQNPNST